MLFLGLAGVVLPTISAQALGALMRTSSTGTPARWAPALLAFVAGLVAGLTPVG
ncbi:hypothetical protein [Streptomyces sp. NPDC008125]|uniref:hypothetical protein n=1 Tax=Streptomyces sp. NPDC008125 TaxID=3364811 RepID=UPI0036E33F47